MGTLLETMSSKKKKIKVLQELGKNNSKCFLKMCVSHLNGSKDWVFKVRFQSWMQCGYLNPPTHPHSGMPVPRWQAGRLAPPHLPTTALQRGWDQQDNVAPRCAETHACRVSLSEELSWVKLKSILT